MIEDREIPARATSQPLSAAHPMLSVADVEASIDFYRSTLGFFLEWAGADESGRASIANLWRGELSLFLMSRSGFGPSCVYCHLDDETEVDELHRDLVEAGAEISEVPVHRSWGLYEMRINDLDGNQFRFACSSQREDSQGSPSAGDETPG